jgi:hypothetical protein
MRANGVDQADWHESDLNNFVVRSVNHLDGIAPVGSNDHFGFGNSLVEHSATKLIVELGKEGRRNGGIQRRKDSLQAPDELLLGGACFAVQKLSNRFEVAQDDCEDPEAGVLMRSQSVRGVNQPSQYLILEDIDHVFKAPAH